MTVPIDVDFERAKLARDAKLAQQGEKAKSSPKKGREQPDILLPLAALVPQAIEQSARRQRGDEVPVQTPWPALNNTLGGGLWAGLHVLCAGTGVGKTQLSLQLASHCAPMGTPVALVALELDEPQLALRLLAEHCRVSWSRAYHGNVTDPELERMRASADAVGALPIYSDFGDAHGWPSLRLERIAQELHKRHPKGPALIVLDFLQLVASDDASSRVDLRERIGVAAYRARNIARRYRVSVLVISSTARNNYDALNAKMSKAGLVTERKGNSLRRAVLYPDALIGTGKEAGEIEYAADSVTVLMRPVLTAGACDVEIDGKRDQGAKIIVAATVKVRAGAPSWFALSFHMGRFESLSEDACNSIAGGSDGEDKTRDDPLELTRAIVGAVAEQSFSSASKLYEYLRNTGHAHRRQDVLAAVKRATADGHVQYHPIDKRYLPGKPLPSERTTDATPDPQPESEGYEQEQLF